MATRNRDQAFAAPSRLVFAGVISLLTIIGLLFMGAGLYGMAIGDDDSWLAALGGFQLATLGALGVIAMLRSRRAAGPVERVDDGVALPLRHGSKARQVLLSLALGSFLLPVALQDDNLPMVIVGSITLALGVAAAIWLLRGGADSFRIRLTPDGLVLPTGWGPVQRFAWREIEAVLTVPKWQPMLVVVPKGNGPTKNGLIKLLSQGWTPETLTWAIDYYTDHPAKRAELGSDAAVQAVEAIRRWPPVPVDPAPKI